MGFFRRHKIKKFTQEEIEARMNRAFMYICECKELEEADLVEWACWREALARKQGENKSPLDGGGK